MKHGPVMVQHRQISQRVNVIQAQWASDGTCIPVTTGERKLYIGNTSRDMSPALSCLTWL